MKQQEPRRWLLDLTFKAMKYLFLSMAGCAITYIVALVLKCTVITEVIAIGVEHLLPRALVLVGCLVAAAVITESVRY